MFSMKLNVAKTLSEIVAQKNHDSEILKDLELEEEIQHRISIENMLSL